MFIYLLGRVAQIADNPIRVGTILFNGEVCVAHTALGPGYCSTRVVLGISNRLNIINNFCVPKGL